MIMLSFFLEGAQLGRISTKKKGSAEVSSQGRAVASNHQDVQQFQVHITL
jgi:hypothetical protein